MFPVDVVPPPQASSMAYQLRSHGLPDAGTTGPLLVDVQNGPPSTSALLSPTFSRPAATTPTQGGLGAPSTSDPQDRRGIEAQLSSDAAAVAATGNNARAARATMLPRVYSYHQQVVQRERQRQRYYAQRRRAAQQSLGAWLWLKLCSRMRKSTVEFFEAVDAGRVDVVRDMARAQPSLLLRSRPGTRWTAAHYAAERGEYATLTALFDEAQHLERAAASARSFSCTGAAGRSADYVKRMVGSLTEKNLTPLMLACKRGHPATATFLMTMGSNPCVADREGAKMAIHYACLYGHWACTQVMMEPRWVVQNGGGLKPLAQAIITDMHGQNRYIDARTCAGLTPLHMAAWAGHVEVAKILLQHGAYLNPKIVFSSPSTSSVLPGSTPTHLATRKNRIHVVKALLTAYLERNREAAARGDAAEDDPRTIPDDRGNYAIMHAIARGNNSMAVLLDANADLETILATDLNQLGQVPKLQTLAMSVLRTRLLAELEALLATVPKGGAARAGEAARGKSKADGEASPRSFILDGSPKSTRPAELGGDVELPMAYGGGAPLRGGAGEATAPLTALTGDSMGLEMGTHNLEDLHYSVKSREIACAHSMSSDVLCGICLEQPETVELTRCGHNLCAGCARQLLVVAASSSCQCPFCRKYIGGFAAATPHTED